MTETTLGANELLQDYKQRSKYVWNTVGQKMHVISSVNDSSDEKVSLTPMQIRTFIVKMESSASSSYKTSSIFIFFTIILYLFY